jgi:hypothetical protein
MTQANEIYQRNRNSAIAKILKVLKSPMMVMSPAKMEALTLAEEYGITTRDLIEAWTRIVERI